MTFFLKLSKDYYEPLSQDTFYLKGGLCRESFLNIKNGKHNGLSITEIKEKINTPLSLKHSEELKIELFPNPVKDKLIITGVNFDEGMIISLYDMRGKRLKQVFNTPELDLSDFKSALYIVELIVNGQVIQKKVQKY